MRKFWPCCRKSNTWPQAHDPEPEIDPEPEPDPEPAPDPEPEPAPELAPEPCSKGLKTDAQETDLKELKTPHHFTQLSIVCMESRKRINTPASSADTLDSSVCVPSDRSNAETIINIMERARRGEKSFLDNSEQKICFLRAISASCMAARESGQDTLNLPYSKDELAEAIVLVARTLPIHSVPPAILS